MTDTIIRTPKGTDSPYVATARASAQNRQLSWDARGVLWYLLSQPDDWKVVVEDLQQGCGRDKVRGILKELEDAGHLEVNKIRNAAGQFDFERLVHEIPIAPQPLTENTSVDNLSLKTPLTEKPEAANPPLHKDSNTERMNTFFAAGFAAAFAAMPKAVDEKGTVGLVPTVDAIPAQTLLPLSPAPESNLLFKKIVVLTPDSSELEVVEEGGKNKTKKGRPRKAGVIPAECINPMKDAIVKAFKWDWKTMSKGELGTVYTAAKQLCEVDFPVDEIKALYDFCAEKFDEFKPTALPMHQSDFRKEHIDKKKQTQHHDKVKAMSKRVVPIGVRSIVRQGWDKVKEYDIDLVFWGIDPSEVGVAS